ncbi:LOW QUALITY PROTEIN: receptor-like protein 12 [Cinnamomum micranthum f. kanehirae]|uniref:Receptor-like protein 12 n=1 Tax=Cinnamomum micranthum f. kanehirae TaxID=337451 RepID=A0A443NK18_9MAGN|nr:LOW QUALITY PROTEIN: receptor-like protein 12 [Cinnamomum micranthum f. kanehirae]
MEGLIFFSTQLLGWIGALSNLTHLNLSNSGFSGYVPVEISRIKSLESLDLSSQLNINRFSSLRFSSPDFEYVVGNLSRLRELYLDGVHIISSRAPESLAGLANLSALHLSSCNLTGAFPVEIFPLRNLEILDLSNNPLLTVSFPEFPKESRLQILSLSATSFSGGLPSSFGNLRHLQRLELQACYLSGTIPSALSNLTHLNLSNSGFTGYVPVEISRIKSLESLDLSSSVLLNNLSSSLRFSSPDFEYVVGNLSGLRELYLDYVDISSPAPESLAGLANLSSLHLSSCNLTGDFPVFRLRNLETLDLSNNPHLTGSLPEFPSGSRLQILSLSYTDFMGRLPNSFGNLSHLQRLEVQACNFSGMIPVNLNLSHIYFNSSIPISISALSNLTHLNLSNSGFTGYVPVEISRIKSLESLDLSSQLNINSLSPLRFSSPDFEYVVGNLSGLRELYLDGVHISSRALESLAVLANLRSLHLSSCNLTGAFPVEIFPLRNLEILDLSNNPHLTVSLPEFPKESRLQILSLSRTNLSGGLPSSFGNLRHLQRLELQACYLSGTIPSSLDQLVFSVIVQNFVKWSASKSILVEGVIGAVPRETRNSSCNVGLFGCKFSGMNIAHAFM